MPLGGHVQQVMAHTFRGQGNGAGHSLFDCQFLNIISCITGAYTGR